MPTKIRDLDSFLQRLYQCGPQPTRFLTCSNHCHWTCAISQWKWIINGDQQFPIGNHEFHGFPIPGCNWTLGKCALRRCGYQKNQLRSMAFLCEWQLYVFFSCVCWTCTGRLCVNPFVVGCVQSDKIMLALVGPTTPKNETVTNHCIPVKPHDGNCPCYIDHM